MSLQVQQLVKKVSTIFKKKPTPSYFSDEIFGKAETLPPLPFHPIFGIISDKELQTMDRVRIETLKHQLQCIQYYDDLTNYLCDTTADDHAYDESLPFESLPSLPLLLPIKRDTNKRDISETNTELLARQLRNDHLRYPKPTPFEHFTKRLRHDLFRYHQNPDFLSTNESSTERHYARHQIALA
jgi:hypothetical protein